MSRGAADGVEGEPALVVEMVDALESRGFTPTEYRLYEYVNVEALTRLLDSTDDLEVQVSVAGVPLRVSNDGVTMLAEESTAAETA